MVGEIFVGTRTPRLDSQGSNEDEKRIFHPGMFAAYFRYELPQALFSSVELEAVVRGINDAPNDAARQRVFQDELNSMIKGDLRRDDFLRKLADVVKSLAPSVRMALVHAAMRAADKYVYDAILVGAGEAGHVLRIVLRTAEIAPVAERAELLSQCIAEATDDTMAYRILVGLTRKQTDVDLGVSFAELYPAFVKRMRMRYGPDVDAAKIDLTTSDPLAFNLWGMSMVKDQSVTVDPQDRAIQYDFWRRYIGKSRSRLAQVFQGVFMPFGIYQEDASLSVENKLSIEDLRRLYGQASNDEALSQVDQKSLRRLQRLLNGEFKNGIAPEQWNED